MAYSESDDFKSNDELFFLLRRSFARYNLAQEIEGAHILEVGGADGVLGGLISSVASRVIVADTFDTQNQYAGQFPKLLKEKFERNGHSLDLSKIEFQVADAMAMPYRDGLFDIVLSRALQHVADPFVALQEVLRVLKPGGVAYLTFDSIWTSAEGSHFSHYVIEPWAHLLYSTDAFVLKMRQAGAAEWEISHFICGLSRIKYRDYETQFNQILESSNLTAFHVEHFSTRVEEGGFQHKFLMDAVSKLECDPSDLLVRGFAVMATK